MAQDDFSFDPRSWSKGKQQPDGGKAEPAKGATGPAATPDSPPPPTENKGKAGKRGKAAPSASPAAPEAEAAPAKSALPEAWSAVADEVARKTAAAPTSAKAGSPPPRAPTTPPGRTPTAPPVHTPTVPPLAGTTPPGQATGKTALPEAWSAVVTGMTPDLPTPPPAAEAQDAAARRGSGGRLVPAAIALSAVLLAGGAWFAFTTRHTGTAPIGAPAAPTARQVVASEAPPPPSALERAINVGSAAELASALVDLGVSKPEAEAAARAAQGALKAAPGNLRAHVLLLPEGEGFRLGRLQASHADGSGVVVLREEDGTFTPRAVAADLSREVKVLHGELDSESFYTSAVSAGLIDTLIPEFINAFGFDFNLASEVQPGDTFEVAYEQSVNDSGEAVGQPQLLYASLTTKAKSVALYRFRLADGTVGWFDGNGASTKRGFMRTPIDGARITSKFGLRFHPVLHYTRLHGGVDFGAPVGTPIYAAADATVVSASPSRCAGNMAVLAHDNGYQTRYFHLSRYADGLTAGQKVPQGFTIGYVGNTGTCTTGPHLHYEVHINGEKVDPLSVKTDDGKRVTMDPAQLANFMKTRDRVDVARAKQAF